MHEGPPPERPGVLPPASRVIAFSSIAGAMTVFGQTAGISVFIDSLLIDLSVSRAEISSVYSAGSLVAAFAMPWIGRLIDRHGSRRAAVAVGLVFGASVVAMSQVTSLIGLALGFFALRMLGQGALSLIAKVVVALRFRTGLGRAVAVTGAATAVGLALFPIILSAGIGRIGWRETWTVGGVAVWLVVIPLALWALPRGSDATMHAAVHSATETKGAEWSRSHAIRTGMFWAISLAVAANSMVITGLTFHQISILGAVGLDPTRAAANFLPQTAASVTALALVGVLADRVPGRAMLGLSMILLTLALLTIQVLDDSWITVVYALLLGSAGGTAFAAEGILYAHYFGVRAIAAIRGLSFTVAVAAAATGPVLIGVAAEAFGDYRFVAAIMTVIPVAVGALILMVRPPASRSPDAA